MKISFLFTCMLVITTLLTAQQQNALWYFGQNAGINFTVDPPMPVTGQVVTGEGSAAIVNTNGDLLFYTSGKDVWDKNHMLMPNGSGLLGGESSTQAALIVPLPESDRYFYLFTTEDHEENGDFAYSIIDMCLRDGLGDVLPESKNTILHSPSAEKLTAVLHANGRDVWIITHELQTNRFRTYLLTSDGIDPNPIISEAGAVHNSMAGIGPIKPSHKGDKLVCAATFFGICEMFDFDNTTGLISNPVDLNQMFDGLDFAYGLEFSPNDRYLYISTTFVSCELYQIDLEEESIVTLGALNGHYHYGALQLAPDGKIYMARGTQPFIGVIHQPDQPGINCQFEQDGFDLADGTLSNLGLPSFIPFGVNVRHGVKTEITATICQGEQWEGYSESGVYIDTFDVDKICDSIRILHLVVNECAPFLHYSLNDCTAFAHLGTNMDYTEFNPEYFEVPECAAVEASILQRDDPVHNKHSCTPGLNNSAAMCFGALNACTYEAGHASSLFFTVTINLEPDQAFQITGFSFNEKAPATYNWIDGPSGPNNYPTRYGFRILRDQAEIFSSFDLSTSSDWQEHHFSFVSDTHFLIQGSTELRFELLPYCPVGNGAEVSAWDVEDLRLFGGCVDPAGEQVVIAGSITRAGVEKLPGAFVLATPNRDGHNMAIASSNILGEYIIPGLIQNESYTVEAVRYGPVMEGVNVLDLLWIQRHVMGSSVLTQVPQFIAADIYPDGEISVLDILQLRKVLLGLNSNFPGNSSWRMGWIDEKQQHSNPFMQFNETVRIDSIQHSIRGVDWTGIKVGDVNESLWLSGADGAWNNRTDTHMGLHIRYEPQHDQQTLVVTTSHDHLLDAVQLSLLLPDMIVLDVNSPTFLLNKEDYFQSGDTLRLIYMADKPFQLTAGDTLVMITVRSGNHRMLTPADQPRLVEGSYNLAIQNDQEVPIKLEWDPREVQSAGAMDMHIRSNPNHGRFDVEISSKVPDSGQLTIVTVDGLTLYQLDCALIKGVNRFHVNLSHLALHNQLVFCQFLSKNHQLARSVIIH